MDAKVAAPSKVVYTITVCEDATAMDTTAINGTAATTVDQDTAAMDTAAVTVDLTGEDTAAMETASESNSEEAAKAKEDLDTVDSTEDYADTPKEDCADVPNGVAVIKQENQQKLELSPVKSKRYMLPTYGVPYPETCASLTQLGASNFSSKLFRPVQFYSTGESEDEDTEVTVTPTGSHISVDSAYGSQADAAKIEVRLHKKNLWKGFMNIGNEMIVTKPGRSLFPTLLVSIRGLHLRQDYTIAVRVAPADNLRYKYLNMKWVPVGESDVIQNEEKQIFYHPSSPRSGQFWIRKPISFKSIKITNNAKSKNGNVLLHTMNKYMLKVMIIPLDKTLPATNVALPLTTFIAVSAYQSMAVTQMKIDNNPFAKAFKYQDNKAMCMPKTLLQAMPPAIALTGTASNGVVVSKVPPLVQPRVYSLAAAGQQRPQQMPILGTLVPSVNRTVRLPPLVSSVPLRPPPLSLRYPPSNTPPAARTPTTPTITTTHTNTGPILLPTSPFNLSSVPLLRGQALPHYYPLLPSFGGNTILQAAPQLIRLQTTPTAVSTVLVPKVVPEPKVEKLDTPECSDSSDEEGEINID